MAGSRIPLLLVSLPATSVRLPEFGAPVMSGSLTSRFSIGILPLLVTVMENTIWSPASFTSVTFAVLAISYRGVWEALIVTSPSRSIDVPGLLGSSVDTEATLVILPPTISACVTV